MMKYGQAPMAAPYTTPRPELPPPGYGGRAGPAVGVGQPGGPLGLRPGALNRPALMGARNLGQYQRGGMPGFGNMHAIPGGMGGALGNGASLGFGYAQTQPVTRGVPR